jgi:hypothetical protein
VRPGGAGSPKGDAEIAQRAFLQYYMLDVMLQINSLPAMIVFVPLAAAAAV